MLSKPVPQNHGLRTQVRNIHIGMANNLFRITQPPIFLHTIIHLTNTIFQVLQNLSSGRVQRSLDLQEAVQGVLPVQEEEGGATLRAVFVGKQETGLRSRMQESQRKGNSLTPPLSFFPSNSLENDFKPSFRLWRRNSPRIAG